MTQCESCTVTLPPSAFEDLKPHTMSLFQLRRTLRALGIPTAGLRPVLASRLQEAIDEGLVDDLINKLKANETVPQLCVVEATKNRREAKKLSQRNSNHESHHGDRNPMSSFDKSPSLCDVCEVNSFRSNAVADESETKTYGTDSIRTTPHINRTTDRPVFSSSSMMKLEVITRPPVPRSHSQTSATLKPVLGTPTASVSSLVKSKGAGETNVSSISKTPKGLKLSSVKNLNLKPPHVTTIPYTQSGNRMISMMSPQTKLSSQSARDLSSIKSSETQWRSNNSPLSNAGFGTPSSTTPSSPSLNPELLERKRREIQARFAGMRKGQQPNSTSPTGGLNSWKPSQTVTSVTLSQTRVSPLIVQSPITDSPTRISEQSTQVSKYGSSSTSNQKKHSSSSAAISDSGNDSEERESYDHFEVNSYDGLSKLEHTHDFSSSSDEVDEVELTFSSNAVVKSSKNSVYDGDDGDNDSKSGIPNWARGARLASSLEKQFNKNNPINPDTIFAQFFTCDLQHIFDTKKKRYVNRGSSGNWHQDRLTITEQLAYQKAMNYAPGTNSEKRSQNRT